MARQPLQSHFLGCSEFACALWHGALCAAGTQFVSRGAGAIAQDVNDVAVKWGSIWNLVCPACNSSFRCCRAPFSPRALSYFSGRFGLGAARRSGRVAAPWSKAVAATESPGDRVCCGCHAASAANSCVYRLSSNQGSKWWRFFTFKWWRLTGHIRGLFQPDAQQPVEVWPVLLEELERHHHDEQAFATHEPLGKRFLVSCGMDWTVIGSCYHQPITGDVI